MTTTLGSESWEVFVAGVHHTRRKRLIAELAVDEKLGMIVALSKGWDREAPGKERRRKLRIVMLRMAADHRRTARRPYLDIETRRMMPETRLHPATRAQAERRQTNANSFFRSLQGGQRRGIPVARIVERESARSAQARLLAHPYGPCTSNAALQALSRTFTSMSGGRRPYLRLALRRRIAPAAPPAITAERALEIALRVYRH